jgi:hypothetical protein
MNRRSFFTRAGAFIAAPAIVPYTRLMPIRGIILSADKWKVPAGFDEYEASMWRKLIRASYVRRACCNEQRDRRRNDRRFVRPRMAGRIGVSSFPGAACLIVDKPHSGGSHDDGRRPLRGGLDLS